MAAKVDQSENERGFAQGIRQITRIPDLDNLGDFYSKARKTFDHQGVANFVTHAAILDYTELQTIAYSLILPLELNPRELYPVFKRILRNVSAYPPRVQVCLAMRCVRAAVLSHQAQELNDSLIIQKLFHSDERLFQRPLLYLNAHLSNPIVTVPLICGDSRSDAILLYYSAVNKLLARDFATADSEFKRSWELSRSAKELRPSIIEGMSLSAFLSGSTWDLFIRRLPEKHVPSSGGVFKIWKLANPYDTGSFSCLYDRFSAEILREHAKRVLIDTAKMVTIVPIEQLIEWCGTPDVCELVKPEILIVKVVENMVYLHDPNLGPMIEEEILELSNGVDQVNDRK
jgi:hypothetical protein